MGMFIALRFRFPRRGISIELIPTPLITTTLAAKKPAQRRTIGCRSYLSSRVSIVSTMREARRSPVKCFSIGRKSRVVIAIARNGATPPARGRVFLCKIAGCLCFWGSSTKPKRLASLIMIGKKRVERLQEIIIKERSVIVL